MGFVRHLERAQAPTEKCCRGGFFSAEVSFFDDNREREKRRRRRKIDRGREQRERERGGGKGEKWERKRDKEMVGG